MGHSFALACRFAVSSSPGKTTVASIWGGHAAWRSAAKHLPVCLCYRRGPGLPQYDAGDGRARRRKRAAAEERRSNQGTKSNSQDQTKPKIVPRLTHRDVASVLARSGDLHGTFFSSNRRPAYIFCSMGSRRKRLAFGSRREKTGGTHHRGVDRRGMLFRIML